MSPGNLLCCCDMSDPVTSQGSSAWSNNIHTHQCLWNTFLSGVDCLGQSWRPLMRNSPEKWASLGMAVKVMISSLSGEAVLKKLK